MREGTKIGLSVLALLGLVFLIFFGVTAVIKYKTDRENKIIIGEGIVTDMEIQNDGGWASSTLYLVSIDGKEFEVSEKQYYKINLGDYIIIYKGGKVTIIS